MGWFKVHSDDLHKVAQDIKEVQVAVEPKPEARVKTRDVKVYIGTYRSEHNQFMMATPSHMCYGKVMTKTSARDAFIKAVDLLMAEQRFNPEWPYAISVDEQTIQELIE